MTTPGPSWSPPQYAIPVSGGAPGGPSGIADFANWTQDDWDNFTHALWNPKFAGMGLRIEGLQQFLFAVVSALQGDFEPFFDLVGELPIIGDAVANFAELVNAFQGSYDGDDAALLAIQNIVGTIRSLAGGIIAPWRIPSLHVGAIRGGPGPNLLGDVGAFAEAVSMQGEGVWEWDDTVGRSAPGSARTVGDGSLRVLTSDLYTVSEGESLSVGGSLRRQGMSYAAGAGAAPKMRLLLQLFDGSGASVGEHVISAATASGTNYDWADLTGNYTVAAGVAGVRVRLTVEETVTGGTVWWDDISLRKNAESMPQSLVSGLTDALSGLWDGITNLVDQALTALGIPLVGNIFDRIFDFADELGNMLGVGEENAASLTNLLGNLLSNPAAVLGMLPQTLVSGLPGLGTMLNQIADIFDGQSVTPVNSAVAGVRDFFTGLLGWQNTTTSAVAENSSAIATLSEEFQASSISQLWASLDFQDLVTFPRVLLMTEFTDISSTNLGTHNHGRGTLSTNSVNGTSGTHSHNVTGNTATYNEGSHSHNLTSRQMPSVAPAKGNIIYTPMVAQFRGRPRYFKTITGDGSFWSSVFPLSVWTFALMVYNPASGELEKVWDAGDRKDEITNSQREYAFDMGGGIGVLHPGTIVFSAQLQNGGGLSSSRSVAAIRQPSVSQAATTLLKASNYMTEGNFSSIPSAVSLSSLSLINSWIPWVALKLEPE